MTVKIEKQDQGRAWAFCKSERKPLAFGDDAARQAIEHDSTHKVLLYLTSAAAQAVLTDKALNLALSPPQSSLVFQIAKGA
jgi:hypothetical protein